MSLLWGKLYDPATVQTKSGAALLAMTAMDTANLRASFNAPANGSVLCRLQGTLHGGSATPWYPQIQLGVLSGSTVMGRVIPAGLPNGLVANATTMLTVEALFLVTGLTSGAAQLWDAAWGVESVVPSSALKYGGPNNTTGNDAFGGFVYEIWST